METLTASQDKAGLYLLIDQTVEIYKPVLFTIQRSNAVLVSEADWRVIEGKHYLLTIPKMNASIKDAMVEPFENIDSPS